MQTLPLPGELGRKGTDLGDACKEGEPLFKQWKMVQEEVFVTCALARTRESIFQTLNERCSLEDTCSPEFYRHERSPESLLNATG